MADQPRILFVAGDGASGRIVVNLMEACWKIGMKTELLVEPESGALALCQNEGRTHHLIDDADRKNIFSSRVAENVCVVAGLSEKKWHLENDVIRAAFARRAPVIRVCDHPLSAGHPHLAATVKEWEAADRPPFLLTAVNDLHGRDLLRRFPSLTDRVLVAGNPLNQKLDEMREDIVKSHAELRRKHDIAEESLVSAVFLSGNTEGEYEEMVDVCTSTFLVLRALGGKAVHHALVNAHHELAALGDTGARGALQLWDSVCGISIVVNVPHDEMIIASDLVITSPFSTTSERAIACGIPVIQIGTPAIAAHLEKLSGKPFPHTPELECGAVLWAETADDMPRLLSYALNTWDQRARMAAAERAGIIAPMGAVDAIVRRILNATS